MENVVFFRSRKPLCQTPTRPKSYHGPNNQPAKPIKKIATSPNKTFTVYKHEPSCSCYRSPNWRDSIHLCQISAVICPEDDPTNPLYIPQPVQMVRPTPHLALKMQESITMRRKAAKPRSPSPTIENKRVRRIVFRSRNYMESTRISDVLPVTCQKTKPTNVQEQKKVVRMRNLSLNVDSKPSATVMQTTSRPISYFGQSTEHSEPIKEVETGPCTRPSVVKVDRIDSSPYQSPTSVRSIRLSELPTMTRPQENPLDPRYIPQPLQMVRPNPYLRVQMSPFVTVRRKAAKPKQSSTATKTDQNAN